MSHTPSMNQENDKKQVLIALHGYNVIQDAKIDIDLTEKFKFISLNNTNFPKAYEEYCINNNVDNREPFIFDEGFLLTENQFNFSEFSGLVNPTISESLIPRALNTIAITYGCPVKWVRLFWIDKDFSVIDGHKEYIDHYNTKDESLNFESICNNSSLNNLKIYWDNISNIVESPKRSRIKNAIDYFYNSWNSSKPEHFILNTSIIFETLFSPGQSELSHRISFYIAKFIKRHDDSQDPQKLYNAIKNFYNTRSKIIHGSPTELKDIYDIAEAIYPISLFLLRTIISNKELSNIFGIEKERARYMDELLFSN